MSAASFAKPIRQRIARDLFPAKACAFLVWLRGRFGTMHNSSWVFAGQPEHLLAYATWSEIVCDPDVGTGPRWEPSE